MTTSKRKEAIEMADYGERQRLKKRMLDRWENEGGRIVAESIIQHEVKPASDGENKGSRSPARADRSD